MPLAIPLPSSYRDLASQVTHPGLYLDKYPESLAPGKLSEAVQRPTVIKVAELSQSAPTGLDYDNLFKRWEASVVTGALAFTGTTAGPLTLHLARASALENAGICLHRMYGFTFLPGTGLKGLARAFACEIWLGEQPDKAVAWQTICDVFGTAPSPWLNDLAERHHQPAPKDARAGGVIFHDAWPEKWPRLVTDILNSHHSKYYQNGDPPGDWEDPVPVYFLSVEPGTKFRFAVAPRRSDTDSELVRLAREWLIGGLTQLGAGAKTASGYGDFTVDEPKVTPVTTATRPSFTATLELVTPAFLAGARQQQEDCDLRPSTLRGQLRWWWRTLHAGFVTVEDLRRMEAAIWGDTKTGGAVRVVVGKVVGEKPKPYDRRQVIQASKIPQPNDGSIPGLTYHSYGMDEAKGRRFYLEPGTRWPVTATARRSWFAGCNLDPSAVLGQFTAALALLTRFGGVGAKARKGFGSFADIGEFDLQKLKGDAAAFRKACGLDGRPFAEKLAGSPSLHQMLPPVEVSTGGTACWLALDRLAVTVQQFVKGVQPKSARRWLGTPRKLRGAIGPKLAHEDRHASPALYHFAKDATGNLVARAVAFPAAELPNATDSRAILTDLLAAIGTNLAAEFARPEIASRMAPAAWAAPPRQTGPSFTKGQRVTARITVTGKGLPLAEAEGHTGIILNPPKGVILSVGAVVELAVDQVPDGKKPITFRWPA